MRKFIIGVAIAALATGTFGVFTASADDGITESQLRQMCDNNPTEVWHGNDSDNFKIDDGSGHDTNSTAGDRDCWDGNGGKDNLGGEDGHDWILGGDGDDTIDGGMGGDTLKGGAGDDFLNGGQDADQINGGAGFDHCAAAAIDTFTNCEVIN